MRKVAIRAIDEVLASESERCDTLAWLYSRRDIISSEGVLAQVVRRVGGADGVIWCAIADTRPTRVGEDGRVDGLAR